MTPPTRTLIWSLIVLCGGTAGTITAVLTAPPETNGDMWDSPLFFPSILVASLLAAIAAYTTKTTWPLYALAAIAPYYANQIINVLTTDEGLAIAGVILLLPITLIPLALALTAQTLGRARHTKTRTKGPGNNQNDL